MPQRFNKGAYDELRELRKDSFYPGGYGNSDEELAYLDSEQPINYDDGSLEGDHLHGHHYEQPHPQCPWCQDPGASSGSWVHENGESFHPAYGSVQKIAAPCAHCGTEMQYAGSQGNQYCPNCHSEHDPYGRPLSGPPVAPQVAPRAGEPFSALDEPARFAAKGVNPSDPEPHDDDDTEDSVLDALEDKVVPEGQKKADVSTPPGTIVPPAEGGPSYPPESEIQQHEPAQPYRPDIALQGLSEHPAVAEQVSYALQQGANPQQARELGYKREQEMLTKEQSGMAVQNINQIASILKQYDHGFVSRSRVEQTLKLLS